MVRVNGENLDVSGKSISELLEMLEFVPSHVAVELNEQTIVPKDEYDSTRVKDGDTVEVVRFVGGGSEFYGRKKNNE